MSIQFKKNRIVLRDVAGVEEAETLLETIQAHPSCKVDLSACTHMHTANLQVLMAGRPPISRWPENSDLFAWLKDALSARS